MGTQNRLRSWPEEDLPLVAVMSGLVRAARALIAARPVNPARRLVHVNVDGTNEADLGRSATREQLQLHHRPDERRHVGQGRIDVFLGNGFDPLGQWCKVCCTAWQVLASAS